MAHSYRSVAATGIATVEIRRWVRFQGDWWSQSIFWAIATRQLPVKKWHDGLGGPPLANATLDRLVHNTLALSLKVKSMSKRKTKRDDSAHSRSQPNACVVTPRPRSICLDC